jgi:hypothetical protein
MKTEFIDARNRESVPSKTLDAPIDWWRSGFAGAAVFSGAGTKKPQDPANVPRLEIAP